MRAPPHKPIEKVAFDMTPMIDCTFQLVVFFLLTLNFSMDDQAEFIKLPVSDLAKPPPPTQDHRVTVQITRQNSVMLGGDVPITDLNQLKPRLLQEVEALRKQQKSVSGTMVVIRADGGAFAGRVQEVIKVCQEVGFERFILRAKEQVKAKKA